MVSCRDAAYDHHEDFDKCQRSWFQMQQTYHNLNLATPKVKHSWWISCKYPKVGRDAKRVTWTFSTKKQLLFFTSFFQRRSSFRSLTHHFSSGVSCSQSWGDQVCWARELPVTTKLPTIFFGSKFKSMSLDVTTSCKNPMVWGASEIKKLGRVEGRNWQNIQTLTRDSYPNIFVQKVKKKRTQISSTPLQERTSSFIDLWNHLPPKSWSGLFPASRF